MKVRAGLLSSVAGTVALAGATCIAAAAQTASTCTPSNTKTLSYFFDHKADIEKLTDGQLYGMIVTVSHCTEVVAGDVKSADPYYDLSREDLRKVLAYQTVAGAAWAEIAGRLKLKCTGSSK
jgi:hypothetical protein